MSVHSPQSLGHLFQELLSSWQHQYAKRAFGGWWALAGFAFQTTVFLQRFFQNLEKKTAEPGQLAEMEQISDILCPHDGRLTLIQVKRTLTKATLISAVEEAYLITDLCRRETPDLLSHLRFQIVCRERKADALLIPRDLSMSDVIKTSGNLESWEKMLDRFDATDPILEESDALDQLHVHLWNVGIKDTTAFIQQCLGRMLRSFGAKDSDAVREVGRDLANLFFSAEHKTNWKPFGRVLTIDDVSIDPLASEYKSVLTGQTPKLEHYRKGFFRDRPQIIQSLWKEYERWQSALNTSEPTVNDRMPVFWISGRSGEGKSVLLLQLASKILQSSSSIPLLHLDSGNDLPDFLKASPEPNNLSDHSTHILAVIDDLYDLEDRDGWDDNVRTVCSRRTPQVGVITCGPTEQREQFSKRLGDQFEVSHFEVPHSSLDECREFLTWYEERTGITRDLDSLTTENPLLVQVVFELAQGRSLKDFAVRFKRRLSRLGVFEEVRSILAVNALYTDAPLALLRDNRSQDVLEYFSKKNQLHFRISSTELGSRWKGVRLHHAHLAWLLFVEWADPITGLAKDWARNLTTSLITWEEESNTPAADNLFFQLLGAARLSDDSEPDSSSLAPSRKEVVRELYNSYTTYHGSRLSPATLSRWLELEYKIPRLELDPAPTDCAAGYFLDDSIASSLHGSAAGWMWLISESKPESEGERLRDAAKQFINRNLDNLGIGTALRRIFVHSKDGRRARQFIYEWLSANPNHPQAHYVIAPMVRVNPTDDKVMKLAANWLTRNEEHPHGYQVIAPLVAANLNEPIVKSIATDWISKNEGISQTYWLLASVTKANPNDKEIKRLAIHWLASNARHQQAYYVLAPLVSANPSDQEIVDQAVNWLVENNQHQQSYQLIAALVNSSKKNKVVENLAIDWLNTNGKIVQAYQVISPLVKANPTNVVIAQYAKNWLTVNGENTQAYNLIATMVKSAPADSEIRKLADDWLGQWFTASKQQRQHPHAHRIITSLVADNPTNAKVKELAIDWLNANEEHSQANNLLAALVKANKTDAEVKKRAIDWFTKYGKRSQIYNLLCAMVNANPTDMGVTSLAIDWLAENQLSLLTFSPLSVLIKANPKNMDIKGLAVNWVTVNGKRSEASTLLGAMLKASPADADVKELAINWLKENEHRPEANMALAAIVRANSNDIEIKAIAIKWLGLHLQTPQAFLPLGTMVKAYPTDSKVKIIAMDWLIANKQRADTNTVLAALVKANPSDFEVKAAATRWLKLNSHASYAFIPLSAMVKAYPTDTEVRTLVIEWLTANKRRPDACNLLAAIINANPSDEDLKKLRLT